MATIVILLIFGYIMYLMFGNRPAGEVNAKTPPPVVEKVVFPRYFTWALVIVVVGFNLFAYDVNYGVGTGLFNLAVLTAWALLYRREQRFPMWWMLMGMSVIAGLGIGMRANGFVQSVDSTVTILVLLTMILFFVLDQVKWQGLWLFKHGLRLIPHSFGQFGLLLKQSQRPELANKITMVTIIKRTFITLIIVAFFANVLSSADPIFAQLIERIKDEAIGRVLVSVIIAVLASVLLTIRHKTSDDEIQLKFFSFGDLLAPMVGVVVVFGVFLFVQAKYLFGSHTDLPVIGLTYSEYVRKGFQELLMATFFGALLVYVVTVKQRILSLASQITQLQVLSAVLVGELFLVLGSAVQRDLLYVEAYGLTRVRIVGGIFLMWLAVILALLLVFAVWRKMSERRLLAGMVVASSVVVLLLNVVNVDHIVATAQPPRDNSKDYFYINSLSEDGRVAWEPSVGAAEEVFNRFKTESTLTDGQKESLAKAKLSLIALQEKRDALFKKYGTLAQVQQVMQADNLYESSTDFTVPESLKRQRAWQSSILSEKKAYEFINDNQALFDRVDQLVTEIDAYQDQYGINLYDQEYKLLYEYKYPFVDIDLNYYPRSVSQVEDEPLASPTASPLLMVPSPSPSPSLRPTPSPSLAPRLTPPPLPSLNPGRGVQNGNGPRN
ncbi:MAG TPA: DUF4153 domain-containing protein [Vitreimonas sp.]|nr:DUF4153 domain-containing protein [Vitreimonas sp.]